MDKPLLAAIDFSKATDEVVLQAAGLSKALGVKLWVLHVTSDDTRSMVYEPGQFAGYVAEYASLASDVQLSRDLVAEEIKREHAHLHAISSKLRADGFDAQAILLAGDVARMIVEKARELDVSIIVLGSRGHGLLHKALLGSVSQSVIRHAPCNVMVVPSP